MVRSKLQEDPHTPFEVTQERSGKGVDLAPEGLVGDRDQLPDQHVAVPLDSGYATLEPES